jgi:hypothetical protein
MPVVLGMNDRERRSMSTKLTTVAEHYTNAAESILDPNRDGETVMMSLPIAMSQELINEFLTLIKESMADATVPDTPQGGGDV